MDVTATPLYVISVVQPDSTHDPVRTTTDSDRHLRESF